MTHSPDHAERAYLMTGPWELDPDGTSPGIYADDPSGGDPVCLATIKRLHHPEKLAAALRGRDRVVEALEKIAAFKAKPIRGTVSEQSATLGWNRAGEWAARVAASGLADRAALHDAAHLQQNGEGVAG
ncbi:hypothetical protein [Sphingomonas melonis]|uniref:Uncharacterized protein n=1 Tax=Sphingomonas melonis TaxID=152682 RepID=A0A7Y9FMF2_9SPHN|nr:hypothetical protein [Sphingomonas melonis]NYD88801.1 hypothetical protein [Sphingomonas melonis]